ncbi:MAG: hypothetical protein ACOC9O_03230, partial [Myxococcota bacterium]
MDPILIAVVLLVVLALALGGLALRKGKKEDALPPPEARKEERPEVAPPAQETFQRDSVEPAVPAPEAQAPAAPEAAAPEAAEAPPEPTGPAAREVA